jgi:hypothetical protein
MNRFFMLLSFLIASWGTSSGQVILTEHNPLVAQMVQEVSEKNLQEDINKLVGFGTRHSFSVQNSKKRGIGAATQWVYDAFQQDARQAGGRMTVWMDQWTENPDSSHRILDKPAEMANVVATLRGTDPADHRLFIMSAHLDSRRSDIRDREKNAPGANDDGSGIAAVLETARIMSNHAFSATVLFVAFSGEEEGLYGSMHLAQLARDSLWNIEALLNNDMIGQGTSSETDLKDNTHVRVFSEGIPLDESLDMARSRKSLSGENDSKSRELARYIRQIAELYINNLHVVLIYRPDRFLRSGDQAPFEAKGFTAVRITDYFENYFHQHQDVRVENGTEYGDLPEFVDFEYLEKNTALNLAVLASLANAPSVPEHVRIDMTKLSNYTRLYWDPPRIGKVAGYDVLVRETDEPMWQKNFFTRDLQMSLPFSRDNYFFAVQAVSADGLKSMPVFPSMGR